MPFFFEIRKRLRIWVRTMEMNEIVALIQSGRTDLYLELWEKVKSYVFMRANSRLRSKKGFDGAGNFGGVEREDLIQAGFIAMMEAVKTYKPEKCKFLTWLTYYLMASFDEANGIRTTKRDPLDFCISLDRPYYEDANDSLGDHVPSEYHFEDKIENDIYQSQLRKAVEKALRDLPGAESEIIRKNIFLGLPLKECGEKAVKYRDAAFCSLRRSRVLNAFIERPGFHSFNPYIAGLGVWNNNKMSVEEMYLAKKYY